MYGVLKEANGGSESFDVGEVVAGTFGRSQCVMSSDCSHKTALMRGVVWVN